jgi:hypothetical protein
MVYVAVVPAHAVLPVVVAKALIVAVKFAAVLLMRLNDGIVDVPVVLENPVIPEGTAADHEMDAFCVDVVSKTAVLLFPEHKD